ncbi:MAG: NlpC/P60 family protein [Hyphomonas sp.]
MPEFNDTRLARPDGPGVAFQVTASVLAVRETPAADGRLSTQALHGEMLDVFREEAGFGLVQCRRDHYVGWVSLDGLSAPSLPVTHKVSALRTYSFAEPHVKSAPRLLLSLGARVAATGRKQGDWMECERAGWVHERHVSPLDQFETDPAAVAARYMEAPYLWGGRESLALDCSGLVRQAFEACGVLLPRDSDMQEAWAGQPVTGWQSPGALRRGDLVFWDGHVGILTSPDTLLHANAYHLGVASEPLADAIARIRPVAGEVTSVRRVALTPQAVPDWLAA